MKKRETFASRIGFLLMTAGCAIGLGNIWRFPFIAGKFGGGAFVILYLACLAFLGFPLLVTELAVGRAGKRVLPGAFRRLSMKKSGFRWDIPGGVFFFGNLVLLMFYTVVTGWLIAYAYYYVTASISGDPGAFFGNFLASPGWQMVFMLISLCLTVAACIGGLRATVERSVKWMMGGLFLLMILLCIKALMLPGAGKGLTFFLKPDFSAWHGSDFLTTLHAAMAQAFFTLSVGIGAIAICGSYYDRDRALPSEAMWIILLDTCVAIAAGLIIFPCCATYGIAPDGGPSLIFIALPKVFSGMSSVGRWWGALFFIFLAVAALSTLVAVFEALVAFGMEVLHFKRQSSCAFFGVLLGILSIPCVLGFNLWKSFQPFGKGSCVLDLEDFLVSDNLLPLGALYILIFCFNGWSKDAFFNEINTGNGWKISPRFAFYFRWVIPVGIIVLWSIGICRKFFA